MGNTKRVSIKALLIGIFVLFLATYSLTLFAIAINKMIGTEWADTYIDDDNYVFYLIENILAMLCTGFYTGRYAYLLSARWNHSLILAIGLGGFGIVESFMMIGDPLADPFALNILYDVLTIAALLYGDWLAKKERVKLNLLANSNHDLLS